jgi:hypothetical protein
VGIPVPSRADDLADFPFQWIERGIGEAPAHPLFKRRSIELGWWGAFTYVDSQKEYSSQL